MKQYAEKSIIYGCLAVSIIALMFTGYIYTTSFDKKASGQSLEKNVVVKMGLTPFDVELAKNFMDKNNDGMCDFCGMKVEDCIASGMMECSMDPNAKIGLLRSAHIHADFKVYLNAKQVNFAKREYYMKSMMVHLDEHPNIEDAGGVLHMHATGVPLWIFFKSVGLELPTDVKLYVNGKLNTESLDYVFRDGDKLLITDATNQEFVNQQIISITDYAKDHSRSGSM